MKIASIDFQAWKTFDVNFVVIFSVFILSILSVLPYCWFATNLSFRLQNIGDDAYNALWYKHSNQMQIYTRQIITYAQIRRSYEGYHFFHCSLDIFVKVSCCSDWVLVISVLSEKSLDSSFFFFFIFTDYKGLIFILSHVQESLKNQVSFSLISNDVRRWAPGRKAFAVLTHKRPWSYVINNGGLTPQQRQIALQNQNYAFSMLVFGDFYF